MLIQNVCTQEETSCELLILLHQFSLSCQLKAPYAVTIRCISSLSNGLGKGCRGGCANGSLAVQKMCMTS